MAMNLSKTQIDRLGERLKKGDISEDDRRLLNDYRRSFSEAYEYVVGRIQKELGLKPTGRQPKTVESITEKLRRESIRLTQIQDIAGCRVVVPDVVRQDEVVRALSVLFKSASIVDRRRKPSHGYRAVHIIVTHLGKTVEIQIRTELQDAWAELSEKLSNIEDPSIKYGGGDEQIQNILTLESFLVGFIEFVETGLAEYELQSSTEGALNEGIKQKIAKVREDLSPRKQQVFEQLREFVKRLED